MITHSQLMALTRAEFCVQILPKLRRVSPVGDGYKAECPGHYDPLNSLTLHWNELGALQLTCSAGCDPAQIWRNFDRNEPYEPLEDDAVAGDEGPASAEALVTEPFHITVQPDELLAVLARHPALQTRAEIRVDVVADYKDLLQAGTTLPPVDGIRDREDGTIYIFDGWHRVHACQTLDRDIEVKLTDGTLDEALQRALLANAAHGLRRSNEDKHAALRAAVLLMESRSENWSDREIARRCGVSQQFVSSHREQLTTEVSSPIRQVATKDGRSYQLNTANIGHAPGGKNNLLEPVPAAVNLDQDLDHEGTDSAIDQEGSVPLRLKGQRDAATKLDDTWEPVAGSSQEATDRLTRHLARTAALVDSYAPAVAAQVIAIGTCPKLEEAIDQFYTWATKVWDEVETRRTTNETQP
jgi:hypothetical protein